MESIAVARQAPGTAPRLEAEAKVAVRAARLKIVAARARKYGTRRETTEVGIDTAIVEVPMAPRALLLFEGGAEEVKGRSRATGAALAMTAQLMRMPPSFTQRMRIIAESPALNGGITATIAAAAKGVMGGG